MIRYPDTNALAFEIARRVLELADYKMASLRKVVEPDISSNTRGKIIEEAIINEFTVNPPESPSVILSRDEYDDLIARLNEAEGTTLQAPAATPPEHTAAKPPQPR